LGQASGVLSSKSYLSRGGRGCSVMLPGSAMH